MISNVENSTSFINNLPHIRELFHTIYQLYMLTISQPYNICARPHILLPSRIYDIGYLFFKYTLFQVILSFSIRSLHSSA